NENENIYYYHYHYYHHHMLHCCSCRCSTPPPPTSSLPSKNRNRNKTTSRESKILGARSPTRTNRNSNAEVTRYSIYFICRTIEENEIQAKPRYIPRYQEKYNTDTEAKRLAAVVSRLLL
ncbi:Hypothetical predicted protein, partial [Drosophila guanche]